MKSPCISALGKDISSFRMFLENIKGRKFESVNDLPKEAGALRAELPWPFQVGKGSARCHPVWRDPGACEEKWIDLHLCSGLT